MRLGSSRPVLTALVSGALAYLAGFALTYGWAGGRWSRMAAGVSATIRYGSGVVSEPSLATLLGGNAPSVTWAGWLFYGAHLVPLSADLADLPPAGSATVPNPVLAGGPAVMGLLVVPPVLLVGAGALAGGGTTSVEAGVRRGATVPLGYLPLVVLGAVVLTASPDIWRRGSVGPDLLASLVVMGLVYPALFGGLGGWLLGRYRSADAETASSTSR